MTTGADELREQVRQRYALAATAARECVCGCFIGRRLLLNAACDGEDGASARSCTTRQRGELRRRHVGSARLRTPPVAELRTVDGSRSRRREESPCPVRKESGRPGRLRIGHYRTRCWRSLVRTRETQASRTRTSSGVIEHIPCPRLGRVVISTRINFCRQPAVRTDGGCSDRRAHRDHTTSSRGPT